MTAASTTSSAYAAPISSHPASAADATRQSKMAYQILHLGFALAPVLFGLDKFFNVMVDWTRFLPGFATEIISGSALMGVVGIVEIAAGLGVWFRPKIFSYVVAAWLGLIIITLALAGGFWDVALRDFGLLLGALALTRLARAHA